MFLENGQSYLVVVTVPAVYAQVGHNPVVSFSFISRFKLTYVRVADVAVIPACLGRFDDLCAGLPYIAFLRGDSFV